MLLGTRTVYLDHNATTPVAREVSHAMARALERLARRPAADLGRSSAG